MADAAFIVTADREDVYVLLTWIKTRSDILWFTIWKSKTFRLDAKLMCVVFAARCYAERGIATVKSSVRDVEVSWWHKLELFEIIISLLVSFGCSLSGDRNITDLLQREHPKILTQSDPVDLSVADIQWQIVTEWIEKAQWSRIGNLNRYRSFQWYDRWPLSPPLASKWGPKCTLRDVKFRMAISRQRVIWSTSRFILW